MSVRQAIELDEHGNICIPSGRDETAIREMFHCVQSANSAVHSAEAKLRDEVDRLRNEGVSWSVIGLLLGMSRGGAQKKFSKPMIRVSADALPRSHAGDSLRPALVDAGEWPPVVARRRDGQFARYRAS